MQKRLIINADDFNLTPGCDRAIEEAMEADAVSSASCLVWDRTPHIPHEMRRRTGVHLRLTDGRPVLGADMAPSLVLQDGSFARSRGEVAALRIDAEQLRLEWEAQIEMFRGYGGAHHPTHLDTHRHTHSLPAVAPVYEHLCRKYFLAGVPLSGAQRDRLRGLDVRCADFAEVRWLDGRIETIEQLLVEDFRRHQTVHMMTHPGFLDDDLRRASGMLEVRRREFDVLMSPEFPEWLEDQGIETICMRHLPAAVDPLEKIDIIFLAWNRPEFTAESLRALAENTDWDRVRRLIVYTDGEPLRIGSVAPQPIPDRVLEYDLERHGGPVAIMNHYIANRSPSPWFAKIDNDVVVPRGWLPECLTTLRAWPNVDLLGIEAVSPSQPAPCAHRSIETAGHIGGIGLMRSAAFAELPVAAGRLGFSDWQIKHAVTKAWLAPSLPVILLDRLPFEPWASLGARYEQLGWQRPWKRYTDADAALWEWWLKA